MKTKSTQYPLRKVIKSFAREEKGVVQDDGMTYTRQYEELECGHIISRKTDIYGHTNAYRRRCHKCPPKAQAQT